MKVKVILKPQNTHSLQSQGRDLFIYSSKVSFYGNF